VHIVTIAEINVETIDAPDDNYCSSASHSDKCCRNFNNWNV